MRVISANKIGALSFPGTGCLLPGGRCDVTFKFKGSGWLKVAMNSEVQDKRIKPSRAVPLPKKTHKCAEFNRVGPFGAE